MAHARRKFHELWANHGSKVGEQAPRCFQVLPRIEEEVAGATTGERRRRRQRKSRRAATALHRWPLAAAIIAFRKVNLKVNIFYG
jgi:transposase